MLLLWQRQYGQLLVRGGSLARRPRLLGYPPTDHLYQTITHDLILFLHLMRLSCHGSLLWMKCVRQTDLWQARVAIKRYEVMILVVESLCECVYGIIKNYVFWDIVLYSRIWILIIIPRKVNIKLVFIIILTFLSMMSYSHLIFDTEVSKGEVTYHQNFCQTAKYGEV